MSRPAYLEPQRFLFVYTAHPKNRGQPVRFANTRELRLLCGGHYDNDKNHGESKQCLDNAIGEYQPQPGSQHRTDRAEQSKRQAKLHTRKSSLKELRSGGQRAAERDHQTGAADKIETEGKERAHHRHV